MNRQLVGWHRLSAGVSATKDTGWVNRGRILRACLFIAALLLGGCQLQGCQSQEEALPPPDRFDAQRAFTYLTNQTDFGPRSPGSQGHSACRTFLIDTLTRPEANVRLQEFALTLTDQVIALTNIVAAFAARNRERSSGELVLGAHWDTRPWADRDPEPANRLTPIPGANDGASGVAVLLEVANYLTFFPPPISITIVLFDAEDSGQGPTPETRDLPFSIGSQHYVDSLGADLPERAIILDMVGDADLNLSWEQNSLAIDPDTVNRLWGIAQALGFPQFENRLGFQVEDDHIPFIRAGVPAVDIIDFDYPYWHTLADTPDKCSPESLNAVGETLLAYIESLAP